MKVKIARNISKEHGWVLCDDVEQVYDLLDSGLVHKLHIDYNMNVVIKLLEWIRNSGERQPDISIQIKGN